MYSVRRWSVRHARGIEIFYKWFEKVLVTLHPLWNAIGYERLEKPVAAVEKVVKGILFDCQMCGQCSLSSSGFLVTPAKSLTFSKMLAKLRMEIPSARRF